MKRRNSRGLISVCIVLVIIGALAAAAWFLSADYRSYKQAVSLLSDGDYAASAAAFEALEDYRDASQLLLEARYGIAGERMEERELLEAAKLYEELGEFRDSGEKLAKCYYKLGTDERLAENYEQAHTYFINAGTYQDAAHQAQRMLYAMGHEAFLSEDYGTAESLFAQLDGPIENYGYPHFQTLADAAGFLDEQLDALNSQIYFHLGQEPGDDFYDAIRNYLTYHYGTVSYYEDTKQVMITVPAYYPGDVILDAWENGDTSALTEDESAVLELALDLVEQAKAETDSEIAMEIWLHDWLCQKVYYESPNMDIDARDYMELRELSCIGAMLDGKANCQGYADAFYLLGNLAGLEVRRLVGDAGEGHMWNMILLDGLWYIVDVTFDDLSDENYDGWFYTYFNAPLDTELYSIWGGSEVLPGIAEGFNPEISYYSVDDCLFSDIGTAANELVRQYANQGKGWAHVMIAGMEADWDALSRQVENNFLVFGIKSASWVEWLEYYAGNTYMSIFWGAR